MEGTFSASFGVLLYFMIFQGTGGVQRFEQQPSYTEVNPGQDALLVCKVFNKRGSCSWQKDNKPMGMYPHKYEWASGSQQNGDCSIWVRAAQLEFDDGNWECQVTASDFHTQDALTSQPIHLVVRVPPQRPRIEYNGTQVLPGHNLTALHGEVAVIKCVSHYGNPPPVLKWFLDQHEITPTKQQTNTTELDNPRTWLALSVLELTISKENHGKTLRCVAVHESYSTKSSSIEVRLDVMYVPETRLVGIPTTDIEDLKDTVAIRCVVSANPKAAVVWRREGQSQPASLQELLQFSPAIRQHSGLYTCQARNKAGESQPIRVQVDVKYPPKIISIGRERVKTVTLFSPATFECLGEGNPQPTYKWLQKLPTPFNRVEERGRDAKLYIANVTYDYQGEYRCKVTNIIKGEERSELSEPIILQVHGAPQVLRQSATPEVFVEKGELADLSMVVCADPRPRVVAWEWGSLRLEAGSEMGRYKVDEVVQEEREDCYLATLHIKDASATDSRAYYLAVENDRGTDRHAVQLYVNEPLQMSTLVSLTGGLLVTFLLLVCGCVYAVRTEKCCFARKGDFKPTDIDGQKVDIEKTATGPGGIPADAIYTTTPRGHGSPEAMKVRLAAMVLHPPTRV
ncbi:irregular chiasm C-roughest protein isoform X3 [Tribolium castaneum]|uniref:irregular chiasm C-roughest protein isoform X3 n=1 Tax=Tribolium castaneum TaxID=7070 RepID=UPI00077DBB43|nr:PREDICTED: irregular chiasm C-roughest protein isoform X3 [Tribolium castaneum]|eukprot:XP_015833193.1 PREDICTED: irregular chiasm C-roughest protein isoform X3 [Tribolium castaneum]